MSTTPPMPQEAGTVNLIADKGAGILLEKPADIVATIRDLVEDSAKYSEMKAATRRLAAPNSTEKIIEEITALLPPRNDVPQTPAIAA